MAVQVSTPVISSMSNLVYDMFKYVFLLIYLDYFKSQIKKKIEPNVCHVGSNKDKICKPLAWKHCIMMKTYKIYWEATLWLDGFN